MGIFNFFKKTISNNTSRSTNPNKTQRLTWVDAQYIEDRKEKEKMLLEIEKDNNDVIDLHFTYNFLIDLYYKQRNEWEDALDNCIKYCWKDINMFPVFIDAYKRDEMRNQHDAIPRIPSFQRLAIIYEKQGAIHEAISVCEKAIEYELTDKTKGGFEGRLKKLQNKL